MGGDGAALRANALPSQAVGLLRREIPKIGGEADAAVAGGAFQRRLDSFVQPDGDGMTHVDLLSREQIPIGFARNLL